MTVDFAEIMRGRANDDPDGAALVWPDRRVSFADLIDAAENAAAWLSRHGVASGSVVGVAIDDEANHLLISLALLWLGAPQVNLPAHEPPQNQRAIAATTRADTAIVAGARDMPDGLAPLAPPFERLWRGRAQSASTPFRVEDDAIFRSTSGSTGIPKVFGVAAGRLSSVAERQRRDPKQEGVLRTVSIQYDSTRLYRILSVLAGRTALFLDRLTPDSISALSRAERISEIHMGTQRLEGLVRLPWPSPLPPEVGILVGGSRVPGALRKATRAITDNLWVSYATSEVGYISMATPDQHEAYPEGVGDPTESVEVRLVDADGNPVAPGEVGEALVYKPFSPQAYLGAPDPSTNFVGEWFKPRDLLSRPEGGPLIYHGRSDDVMMMNGIKVFPSAIEDTLSALPDVAEAVAYPIRSRVHGDIPVAAVVLRPDAADDDPRRLLAHCTRALGVLGPRKIFVLDRIPRTSTGKPIRRELPG